MKWFRLYPELLRDPRAQSLRPVMFKHWINLLCLASENTPRGILPDVRTMALALHLRADRCHNVVRTLTRRGLFDVTTEGLKPHNWDKFQYKSDNSTARVKRFRNVAVTPPDTDTETETDPEGVSNDQRFTSRTRAHEGPDYDSPILPGIGC